MNPGASIGELLEHAVTIWRAGGWAMVALALNGLVMFGMGMMMFSKLAARGGFVSPDLAWRKYREDPARVGRALRQVLADAAACSTLEEVEHYFDGLRNAEVHPFERDLRVMKATVSAAPLLGLLGTVTGMLSTFRALAIGGGGTKTMDLVAGGVSEALVTTETGLVLALSGLIFQFILTRKHERYGEVIAHLETLSMQDVSPTMERPRAA